MNILFLLAIVIWLYALSVLKRAELPAIYFIVGSIGFFFTLFFLSNPYLIWLMVRAVSSVLALIVQPLHMATVYSDYGLVMVNSGLNSISMTIDYECSGVIETAAFWALLTFYPMYQAKQKIILALTGLIWIYFANVVRLTLIILIVHLFGTEYFFLAHSIIGRIIFYILVVFFYYKVFTYGLFNKD
ncbi:MAG: exosortase family protein XrtG [Streptococcaceae bacterium]|nr:exosortase family protein XrtG [Streptococcaceae bacterium]MCH4177490.1 exosortase family protein XrtG [Streptococcaceae bacterium]